MDILVAKEPQVYDKNGNLTGTAVTSEILSFYLLAEGRK